MERTGDILVRESHNESFILFHESFIAESGNRCEYLLYFLLFIGALYKYPETGKEKTYKSR